MEIKDYAKYIFDSEIESLKLVKDKISDELENVINIILECKGKIVITGIGKSGHIGKKISATLSSTGTNSIFMNAAEGLHGDLGMIAKGDVVIAISNSGNSDELISLIPSIKKIGARLIAMTGNKNSVLSEEAEYTLDIGIKKESCPLDLAPMDSTTSTLVMGDALAAILMKLKNFKPENFAVYHPGGSLGKRLLMRVSDIMKKGDELPKCSEDTGTDEIIIIMSKKRLGAVCVMSGDIMTGIITEGDIRRSLKHKEVFFSMKAKDIATKNFIRVEADKMAVDALDLMENRENQISVLPVFEKENLVGMLRIHDLIDKIGR